LFFIFKSYGTPVAVNGNEEASNQCPICQEKFKNPVLLKCKVKL